MKYAVASVDGHWQIHYSKSGWSETMTNYAVPGHGYHFDSIWPDKSFASHRIHFLNGGSLEALDGDEQEKFMIAEGVYFKDEIAKTPKVAEPPKKANQK